MIIEEPDFRLTPIKDDSLFYDLELLYIVKPKGGEARKEFKNAGYGLTMEHALKKIINYRINCKFPDKSVLTLKKYLQFFKLEKEKLSQYVS